jgi:hypothetical protein
MMTCGAYSAALHCAGEQVMDFKRIGIVALIGALGLGASACTDGYGYGGAAVGYGPGGYYDDGYGYGGYGGGGYGYGGINSYYGWNDNFYYPGTGVYVYDRNRRAYRWNGNQQRYWQGRGNAYWNGRGLDRGDRRQIRNNWQDFRGDVRADRRDYRGDVRDARQDLRQGEINRGQFRDRRQDARREYRGDVRQERRQLQRQNRRVIRNR